MRKTITNLVAITLVLLANQFVRAQSIPFEISGAVIQVSNNAFIIRATAGATGLAQFTNTEKTIIRGLFLPRVSITGLEERSNEVIYAYPNPVSDELTIRTPSGEAEVVIINAQGQNLQNTNTSNKVINMREYAVGLYFIKVKDKFSSQSKILKIIKQ